MGYFEDELAKTTDPERIESLNRLIAEDAPREAAKASMISILKSHGISMRVSGCGCCDSPSVSFSYGGEEIIVDEGMCGFDTEVTS